MRPVSHSVRLISTGAPVRSASQVARPKWSGWKWVISTRATRRPPRKPPSTPSHTARVASFATPVSMIVQPSASSSSQRLTWSSANGRRTRSQ